MNFAPLNEDHAVQSVSFEVSMSRPLDGLDLPALASEYRPFSEELPAAGSLGQEGVSVEFAYHRPDGTSIWAFRASANEFVVECTRYTRWEKVWPQAFRYLLIGLKAASARPETRFGGITLRVVDKFVSNPSESEEYNLAELLKPSPLLAACVFEKGPAWHSKIGWFEEMTSDVRSLNQLDVSGKGEGSYSVHAGDFVRSNVVEVVHVQQIREVDLSLDELLQDDKIERQMSALHAHNKKLLTELLHENMQRQISLWSE